MTAENQRPPVDTDGQRAHEAPRSIATIDLVALPNAISLARVFVTDTLHRWSATAIEPDLLAVATELLALSVNATGPPEGTRWRDIQGLNPITLSLLGFQAHIGIEVADTGKKMVALPDNIEPRADSGLDLIAARSRSWGSYPTLNGRVLWADFAVDAGTAAGSHQLTPYPRTASTAPASEPTTSDLLRALLDRPERH